MAGQDRIPCPHCGANNMPGSAQCWRCHAALAPGMPGGPQYPYYPAYAARPSRTLSCWLIGFLLACFLCAGGGLGAYYVWRQINPEAKLQQDIDQKLKTDTERRLDELLKDQPALAGSSELPGIRIHDTKQQVLDRLGEPLAREQGYVITEDGQALSREIWHYKDGWVMFRYSNVVESGPNPAPILTKELPGPVGSFGGRY
jgi:hypothetical protein